MLRSVIVIALLLTMDSLSVADIKDAAKSRDDRARRISKVLPAEYSAFEKVLSGDNGVGDARAVIRLMSKARSCGATFRPNGRRSRKVTGRCRFRRQRRLG